jgi:hypothetical protein
VSIPGFERGRRWVALAESSPRFCATMQLDALEVLTSDEYIRRLDNPTEWTVATADSYRGFVRCAFLPRRIRARGAGGYLVTARLLLDGVDVDLALDAVWAEVEGVAVDGLVTSALAGRVQPTATERRSEESRARTRTEESVCDAVLLAECTSAEVVGHLGERIGALQVGGRMIVDRYALEFDMQKPEALQIYRERLSRA